MKHDILGRFDSIMQRMMLVIKGMDLADFVHIDEDRLGRAVVDYFEDIDKLKSFEEIERINVSKIYAYETYWISKRKPIVVNNNIREDGRLVFINEIVCSMMFLSNICSEIGKYPNPGNPQTKKFYELLYYNLKYRDFTAKNLELCVEAFLFGFSFNNPDV